MKTLKSYCLYETIVTFSFQHRQRKTKLYKNIEAFNSLEKTSKVFQFMFLIYYSWSLRNNIESEKTLATPRKVLPAQTRQRR